MKRMLILSGLLGILMTSVYASSWDTCKNKPVRESDPFGPDKPGTAGDPFLVYNGSFYRGVVDLQLVDGAVKNGLKFERMSQSRWPDNYVSDFGSGGNWRHNFFWRFKEFGSNEYGTVINVSYPIGGHAYYYKSSANSLFYSDGDGSEQNIIQSQSDSNQYYFLRPGGERIAFYRGTTGVFQVQGYYDAYEHFYSFTYNTNGQLIQVTDPITNHYIKFNYGYPSNATMPGSVALRWTDTAATSVVIAATWNGCDFRSTTMVGGTPAVAVNTNASRPQNVIGENFGMNTNGGCLYTTWDHELVGFGSFGKVYVNHDQTNLYIGGLDCYMQMPKHGMVIFLGVDSLNDDVSSLMPISGHPLALQHMGNLSFGRPMDIGIILGDEWGDVTDSNSQAAEGGEFWGQGIFYLGPGRGANIAVPGAILAQFDGRGTNATTTTDDDGNRQTDRWIARIPLSALNAAGVESIGNLDVAGVFIAETDASGLPPYARFISSNYLGDSADGAIMSNHNFGFNEVKLTGTRIRLPGQGPIWARRTPQEMDVAAGTPVVTSDPDTQNNIGDAFDFNTNGAHGVTSGAGFGDFGSVYMNYDSSNLYIGGHGLALNGNNNAAVIFLGLNTLMEDATNLWNKSGVPNGLDFMHNLHFGQPIDVAILIGDEWGDANYASFNLVSGYNFGQGVFYLGGSGTFANVSGAKISQFDGTGTNATTTTDDDGNQATERWEVSIPWTALNANNISSVTNCVLAGVIASDWVSESNRYLSGRYLGSGASGTKDVYNNYGVNTMWLTGITVRLPGSPPDLLNEMMYVGGGQWTGAVNLTQGAYEYMFLVNGTNWVTDTNSVYAGSGNGNSSQIIVSPELLLSVAGSDGRSVGYEYNYTSIDGVGHAMLTKAVYGDGTAARYSYSEPILGNHLRPKLTTMDDPMIDPPYSRLTISYQGEEPFPSAIFGVSGFMYEQRHPVTSQLIARLTTSTSGENAYVEYGDGGVDVYTFDPTNETLVTSVTNGAGELTRYLYDSKGFLTGYIYDNGRTLTRSLTPYYGVFTSEVDSARGVSTWLYTDASYPMHLSQYRDPLGRMIDYARDGSNRVTQITYPEGTHEDFTYTSCGQVQTRRDRDGVVWSNSYDSLGHLVATRDPNGNLITYGHDEKGRISAITNQLGHVTRYEYNWRGQQTCVVFADGTSNKWSYNAYGQVTNIVYVNGGQDHFTYDEWGNLASRIDPLGHTTLLTSQNMGEILRVELPNGLVVSNTYDKTGRRVRELNLADGSSRSWTYDIDGVRTYTNQIGQWSAIDYDEQGKLRALTTARGNKMRRGYDPVGNLRGETNALGEATLFTYDAANRLVSTQDPLGAVVTNTYDGAGRLLRSIDRVGDVYDYQYNAAGHLLSVRRNSTVLLTNTVNALGWVLTSKDASGLLVSNSYDVVGHLVKRTMPDGTFEQFRYTNGYLYCRVDRAGRTNRFERDLMGRVTNQIDQAGHSVGYSYNKIGQLTKVRDQNGNVTEYAYDASGRKTANIQPDGRRESFGYNLAGQLISRTNASGQVALYSYDPDGNLTNVDLQGDADIAYGYDMLDRRVFMADGVGTTTWNYASGWGVVSAVDGPFPGDTVTYTYDLERRLTNVAVAGMANAYCYDSLRRISSVIGPEGNTQWTYDGSSRRAALISRSNGTVSRFGYDGLARLTNLLHETSGASALASVGYSYNNADERVRMVRNGSEVIDFAYDTAGRLASAHGSQPGYDYDYQYDPAGNHLRQEQNGFILSNSFNNLNQLVASRWSGSMCVQGEVSTTNATVQVNDRLALILPDHTFVATNISLVGGSNSVDAVITDVFGRKNTNTIFIRAENRNYGYDLRGNLTNDGERIYVYNQLNQLVEMRDGQGGSLQMTCRYDGLGRRRERVLWENGVAVTNRYIYQGMLVRAVLDGGNQVLETFTHGPDLAGGLGSAGGVGGLIATRKGGGSGTNHWYLYDGLGNVAALVADAQAPVALFKYAPYGQTLLRKNADAARFQFSSKEADPGSLLYYGYRHLNTRSGRWTTRDPIGQAGGINLYTFADNSPLNSTDPFGLSSQDLRGPSSSPSPAGPNGGNSNANFPRYEHYGNWPQPGDWKDVEVSFEHFRNAYPANKEANFLADQLVNLIPGTGLIEAGGDLRDGNYGSAAWNVLTEIAGPAGDAYGALEITLEYYGGDPTAAPARGSLTGSRPGEAFNGGGGIGPGGLVVTTSHLEPPSFSVNYKPPTPVHVDPVSGNTIFVIDP